MLCDWIDAISLPTAQTQSTTRLPDVSISLSERNELGNLAVVGRQGNNVEELHSETKRRLVPETRTFGPAWRSNLGGTVLHCIIQSSAINQHAAFGLKTKRKEIKYSARNQFEINQWVVRAENEVSTTKFRKIYSIVRDSTRSVCSWISKTNCRLLCSTVFWFSSR